MARQSVTQRSTSRQGGKGSAPNAASRSGSITSDEGADSGADDDVVVTTKSKAQVADTVKRYQYLLGQTEVFSHFLKLKNLDQMVSEADAKASKGKKASADRRHRKTEKEEDAELLREKGEDDNEGSAETLTESPHYIEGKMRDYQLAGLNWLIGLFDNGINGILADEMGLGKTLQSISFLGYLKHYRKNNGPHLVVVPKSTLHNWESEVKKWCPTLRPFLFHGSKEERAVLVREKLLPGHWDVLITSYEMCLLEKAAIRKIVFQYIVIDEAHRIKNENSLLSQIVRTFDCRNRLLLTGTPLQNNLHELWALLNFLLPDVFSSAQDFDEWFDVSGADQDNVVKQLHKVLRPFLLRRLKADVEKSLLPKKEVNLYVGLSDMQRQWYRKLLEKDIDAVNGPSGSKQSKTRLLNIVMQLRKCCNHPYLFDGAEPGPPFTTDYHLVKNAQKMVVLDKLLERMKAQGSRVLIFSQMSRVLDILEDYCGWRNYQYCRIDGSTDHADRITAIDEYQKPDSEKFIFLLTTRAGGLGINLTTADIVVLYDSDWNPQSDLQAMDRAHRIGQKKQVVVYRFITEDSVEEKVIEKAASKLRLDQLVIQQGRAANANKGASNDELLTMIQHGASKVFTESSAKGPQADSKGKGAAGGGGGEEESDLDIESILARGEAKTKELHGKFLGMGLDDLQNFTLDSAYTWEGADYAEKKKQEVISMNWIAPAKRERRVNYNDSEYWRDAMRAGPSKSAASASSRHPKGLKHVSTNEWHFFPARVFDLQEKEYWAQRKAQELTPLRPEDEGDTQAVAQYAEELDKYENAEPFTDTDRAELDALSAQGFPDWNKRDYQQFIRACEKHGRKNLEAISADVDGKSLEDTRAYAAAFWARLRDLADWERVLANIERGEAKLQKLGEMQEYLKLKVSLYKQPLTQMKLLYNQNKGRHWSEEEDRFLVVKLASLGYGNEETYEQIRREVHKCDMFKFNFHIRSRRTDDIKRRCNTLVLLIAKEMEAEIEKSRKRKLSESPPQGSKLAKTAASKKR